MSPGYPARGTNTPPVRVDTGKKSPTRDIRRAAFTRTSDAEHILPASKTPDAQDLVPSPDAQYPISVEQLPPDTTEYVSQTLVRYSDGTEDAWIELPTPDNPEPANPAPRVTVAAAPPVRSTPSAAEPPHRADGHGSGPGRHGGGSSGHGGSDGRRLVDQPRARARAAAAVAATAVALFLRRRRVARR